MFEISSSVETVAHVIQIALTPVFLFSGVATLLSVLATRLGRVADRVDALTDRLDMAGASERARLRERLRVMRRRTQILDLSVILAALAGASTLLSAGLLFVDGLRDRAGVTLFVAFGCALLLTIGALAGFLYEMMLSSVGIRHEAASSAQESGPREPEAPEAAETPEPPGRDTGESGPAAQ